MMCWDEMNYEDTNNRTEPNRTYKHTHALAAWMAWIFAVQYNTRITMYHQEQDFVMSIYSTLHTNDLYI